MNQPNDDPKCWWCGAPATTREHRVKRSRIQQIIESSTLSEGEKLLFLKDNRLGTIGGANAAVVKFGMTLCVPCNNDKSQPFDSAYDIFVSYLQKDPWKFIYNPLRFWKRVSIDWGSVFEGKKFDQRHLARYFIKNAACRMVDDGWTVPGELIDYLNRIDAPAPFMMRLFSDHDLAKGLTKNGIPIDFNFANQDFLFRDELKESGAPCTPENASGYITEWFEVTVGIYFEWIENSGVHGLNAPAISDETTSSVVDYRSLPRGGPLHRDLDWFKNSLKKPPPSTA